MFSMLFNATLVTSILLGTAATEPLKLGVSDAVRLTLEHQIQIKLVQEDLKRVQGESLVARSIFDINLRSQTGHARTVDPLTPSTQTTTDTHTVTDNTTWQIGVEQLFPWGMTVGATGELTRTHGPAYGPSGNSVETMNKAGVFFTISQHLLKGLGTTGSASNAQSVEELVKAASLDLEHSIAISTANTVTAYWNLVASEKILSIRKASEERNTQLLHEMKLLVQGEQRPKADLDQVLANLANKTATRILAERAVRQAKEALILSIGLPGIAIHRLAHTQDPFPSLPRDAEIKLDPGALTQTALRERADLESTRRRLKASQIALSGFTHNTLPTLDLDLSVGYTGAQEGPSFSEYMGSLGTNLHGVSGSALLTFTWPLLDLEVEGNQQQAIALKQRAEYEVTELERSTSIQVERAVSNLRTSMLILKQAQITTSHFRSAEANQTKMLKAGLSTTIALTLTEESLTSARVQQVLSQRDYALAIANLRFQTGTLVKPLKSETNLPAAY